MTQLMVISPAEYDAGVKRIRAAAAEVGTEARLRADLRIYGTMGWIS